MAKHPAIFIDRDGTIVEDNGYINDTSNLAFFSYSFKALSMLQEYFFLFIITNQSGISKGLITDTEVEKINKYLLKSLKEKGITVYDIFVCPHRSEDLCGCKKPNPYFINKAAELYNLDLTCSYIIGDHPSDIECGINAGVKPIYLLTGHGKKHLKELTGELKICKNILTAANYIINTNTNKTTYE